MHASAEPAARMERLPRPVLTIALLCTLALIYLGEATITAGPSGTPLDPSIATLVAWGGMSGTLVVERGEWFRLLTAAFLHGGLVHLAMNSLALYIAGAALEPFIGRLWLAALFVLGAFGGGLASISFNAPNIVGIGASGAIMGLFGFFLTIAFRFPKGPVRRAFITNSLGALIPSLLPALLPVVIGGAGFSIDYAAHGGGALAGAALGLLFAMVWRDTRFPPLRPLAAAVLVAGVLTLGWGVSVLVPSFAEQTYAASLMSDEDQPKTDEEARRRADELIAAYPQDPRGYFYKALALADRNDASGMEKQARIAVNLAEKYPGFFRDRFRGFVRATHAIALQKLGKVKEAQAQSAPVCARTEPELIALLRKNGLCTQSTGH